MKSIYLNDETWNKKKTIIKYIRNKEIINSKQTNQ